MNLQYAVCLSLYVFRQNYLNHSRLLVAAVLYIAQEQLCFLSLVPMFFILYFHSALALAQFESLRCFVSHSSF